MTRLMAFAPCGSRRSGGTRAWTFVFAAVLGITLSCAAGAQSLIATSRFYKAVNPGGSVEITQFYALDPQCRSQGFPEITLLVAPHGGGVETGAGRGFPSYPASNARAICNRRKVPSTRLVYHASRDFSGTDVFDIEVQFPDGFARKYRYAVIVR